MSDNLPAEVAEFRQLQTQIADRGSDYWRGANALTNQRRYRELVDLGAHEHGKPKSPADAWRASPLEAVPQLPAKLVREWTEINDFTGRLRLVQDHLRLLYHSIGGDWEGFEAHFRMLPEGVQTAILRELGAGFPANARSATPAELEAFRCMGGGGAEAAAAWGVNAARRLGRALARMDRIMDNLKQLDLHCFEKWWTGTLTPRERLSILWSLAAQ